MKYLDINRTIIYVEEERKIVFLENESKNFVAPDNQQWNLFLELLKNEGNECRTIDLESKLFIGNRSGRSADSPVKTLITRLKGELQERGIPCNKGEEKDETKISILNKRNSTISGIRTGAYTLIIPKKKNNDEQTLADLYWRRYENLSAQKDGENKSGEIVAKVGDVYQFPLMQEEGKNCIWNLDNHDAFNRNILIEAPNGFGKTTFMRSIMLSSSYAYKDCLTEKEITQYEQIRKFHGIDSSTFFVYLECKHIAISSLTELSTTRWIYDALSQVESIRISHSLDIETFNEMLKRYNTKGKLILLIDGFDEISTECRSDLLKKIDEFQEDKEFGYNSRVVVTTRPLFWNINFHGYRKYTISNKNIVEDRNVLRKYIESYVNKYKQIESICDYIENNPYLKDIVCTPAIIVWAIREYQGHGDFYESIERIIEQMMLRYNSRELTVYKEQYKMVYENIAFNYLCLTKNNVGLPNYNNEILSIIRSCIEKLRSQGNKQFNKVFADDNKDDEELGELFFTNVALMECIEGRIKFNSLTYAYHLSARYILRGFVAKDSRLEVVRMIELLPYEYRYYVMAIAATLVMHLTDARFFSGYGDEAGDIRFELSTLFFEYIKDKWEKCNVDLNEKLFIQDGIARMLLGYYGESVYTNPNAYSQEYVQWFDSMLSTGLGQSSSSVLKYIDGKR